jgi:hypothetical protein
MAFEPDIRIAPKHYRLPSPPEEIASDEERGRDPESFFGAANSSGENLPSMPGIFPHYPRRSCATPRMDARSHRAGRPRSGPAMDTTKKRAEKLEANGKALECPHLSSSKGITGQRARSSLSAWMRSCVVECVTIGTCAANTCVAEFATKIAQLPLDAQLIDQIEHLCAPTACRKAGKFIS